MNDNAYFRLFDLPGELVEYVSFSFFDRREAHKLLTVSHTFHGLFSRRVWSWFDSRVFTLSEPTRSMTLARYGGLVHSIALDYEIYSVIISNVDKGIGIYDTLSVLSGVTTLWINLIHNPLASNGIQFTDIIMCFPNLYNLHCGVHGDNGLYDLTTLALAINHRQSHREMSPIEHLNLEYFVGDTDNPWTRLSSFVQMVTGNCAMRIRISSPFDTAILPSPSELQILSKCFVENPEIEKQEYAQYCYAALNRSLFWNPVDLHSYCTYPRLRQLDIRTCCMSSDTYDYCDFTPVNFPRLQSINITEHECESMISNSYPPAWERVLLQTWPHLKWLRLSINMTCEQLVNILEYNCSLIGLHINLPPRLLDENNTFNLATILPLLSKLQRLIIAGNSDMKLDYNTDYSQNDILARSHFGSTSFIRLCLSSSIIKLLYSLPKLGEINIQVCRFYSTVVTEVANMHNINNDPNEIDMVDNDNNLYVELMTALNTVSAKYLFHNQCGIKQFDLNIRRGDYDYDWPLDVTLEMIALMPELRTFTFLGDTDDIPVAVKARFPYINVTHKS